MDRFFDLMDHLGEKLGPVLWQLPPQMRRDDDRLGRFAGALPAGHRHAFEFRHPGWFCQEVYDILERAGAALCIPDHPDLPAEQVLTADWTYLRFHHGNGASGNYTEAELGRWAGAIKGFTRDGIDVFAYFNNDWEGYAVENALRLRELVGA